MKRSTVLVTLLVMTGCSAPQTTEISERCEAHPLHADLRASAGQSLRIIATLDAPTDGDVAKRQDALLTELEGTDYTVVRRPENFAILALSVREEAFCRVVTSELVQAVQKDVAVPPGTS